MIGWILVAVLAFGSWYFDHHRKRARRLNELGASIGFPRLPGERNAAYESRMGRRFVAMTKGPYR